MDQGPAGSLQERLEGYHRISRIRARRCHSAHCNHRGASLRHRKARQSLRSFRPRQAPRVHPMACQTTGGISRRQAHRRAHRFAHPALGIARRVRNLSHRCHGGGVEPRKLFQREAILDVLHWSPDSRHIFFSFLNGSVDGKYQDAQSRVYWVDAQSDAAAPAPVRWASEFPGAIMGFSVSPSAHWSPRGDWERKSNSMPRKHPAVVLF